MNNASNRPQMAVVKTPPSFLLQKEQPAAKKGNPSARLYAVARKNYEAKRYSFDDNGGGYRGL